MRLFGTRSATSDVVTRGLGPISESFAGGIPGSWTIVDGGSGSGAYTTWTTDATARTIDHPFVAPWAIASSMDAAGNPLDEELVTPSFGASGSARTLLTFKSQYLPYYDVADVDVSTDGGASWSNVVRLDGVDDGYPTPVAKLLDITSAVRRRPAALVRFHYQSQNAYWWGVDDVKVSCCHVCGLVPDEVSPPSSSEPLRFTSPTTLVWEQAAANEAQTFDVYRSTIDAVRAGDHGACLQSGLSTPAGADAGVPAPGQCFTYLVTGKNGSGEGTLGSASDGAPRPNLAPCP